jgi:hypothetical protein
MDVVLDGRSVVVGIEVAIEGTAVVDGITGELECSSVVDEIGCSTVVGTGAPPSVGTGNGGTEVAVDAHLL